MTNRDNFNYYFSLDDFDCPTFEEWDDLMDSLYQDGELEQEQEFDDYLVALLEDGI